MDRQTSPQLNHPRPSHCDASDTASKVAWEKDSLLSKAATELRILDTQAELARVEARRLELVTAIQHAHQGNTQPLRVWLQVNGHAIAVDPGTKAISSGWEAIRQQSIDRLPDIQPVDPASPTLESQSVVNGNLLADLPVAEKDDLPVAEKKDDLRKHQRTKRRWQMRGILVSTIVHVLLILVLGVITVAVPIHSGIFELESSESTETVADSFEMTSEVAVEAPSEPFDVSTNEWQPDLSSTLNVTGQTSDQMLSDLGTDGNATSQLSKALSETASHSPKNLGASFYGASAVGNCFCFLIDGSATLRGAPWEAARAELLKTLSSLSEKQRFYVIFYNKVVSKVPDRESGRPASSLVYATRENLQFSARWLQSLRVDTAPAGGNHTTVLQAALDLEPDAIFMLTDGEMTPGVEREVLGMLRNSNRVDDVIEDESVRTPVHTIAFHSLKGVDVMKKIAEQNRGQMTFVPKPQ